MKFGGIELGSGKKKNAKESKNFFFLKNWIYVQWIPPNKKKYFVLAWPIIIYEIADGVNSITLFSQDLLHERDNMWWRSRHRFKGSRSSTNWADYESTSKEVQGCTQRTHPRVMGSSTFVEAHWAWSTWATKNRQLDSSSRRIRSRLRIGMKYFGSM